MYTICHEKIPTGRGAMNCSPRITPTAKMLSIANLSFHLACFISPQPGAKADR
jgi:hypothetical protein